MMQADVWWNGSNKTATTPPACFFITHQAGLNAETLTMGLKKSLRLTHPDDFARMRREGRVFRNPLLLLSVLPNNITQNRYGFITNKRVGTAVERNRVRRLLREIFRLHHPSLQTGFDVVIVANSKTPHASFHELYLVLGSLFRQSGLIISER